MKKSSLVSACLILFVSSFIGCSQPDVSSPPVEKEPDAEPFQSEIALREKELGLVYFKRDLVVSDKDGDNTIMMRYASLDKQFLDDYLRNFKYEIVPASGESGPASEQTGASADPHPAVQPASGQASVITEIISKKLQKGIKGFYVKVTPIPTKNARTTDGPYSASHMSEDWPERLHFTLNASNATFNDQADFYVRIKNGGLFATWQNIPQLDRISPAPAGMVPNHVYLAYINGQSGIDWVYNIDGPKKVELFVNFTRIGGYSFWFQNL